MENLTIESSENGTLHCVVRADGSTAGYIATGPFGGMTLHSNVCGYVLRSYTGESGVTLSRAARELARRTDPRACTAHRVTGYGAASPCADCYR